MTAKLLGVVFVILGCGSVGFCIASNYKREEKNLRRLIGILDFMACELQYRLPSLPQLCRLCAKEFPGFPGSVFLSLSVEMEAQVCDDLSSCMASAVDKASRLSPITRQMLLTLGNSIGRFDLEGQLKGLEAVRQECRRKLSELSENRDIRLRSYQTLSLCAGAAIAILLV